MEAKLTSEVDRTPHEESLHPKKLLSVLNWLG